MKEYVAMSLELHGAVDTYSFGSPSGLVDTENH